MFFSNLIDGLSKNNQFELNLNIILVILTKLIGKFYMSMKVDSQTKFDKYSCIEIMFDLNSTFKDKCDIYLINLI